MSSRLYQGNLGKRVSEAEIKRGVLVADHLKVDAELLELTTRIAFADPSMASKWGNHDASVIPITTPGTANAEFAVTHQLGRTPVGFHVVVPAIANYSFARLKVTRVPDATYLYVSSPDTGASCAIVIW